MALGIIFIFGMSSIAFVFSSFEPQQSNTQLKPLEKYVVDGEIDQQLEAAYIQGGFTFLKFYYNTTVDRNLVTFIEHAPESFTTPSGQTQLIILKIQSPRIYARVINVNTADDLSDLTTDKIFDSLCKSLISPPAECVVGFINVTS